MDIYKRNKYLIIIIILLVIMNVSTLFMLWLGKPQRLGKSEVLPSSGSEDAQILKVLKYELGFDENQTRQYSAIRKEHRGQISQLNNEIRQLKRQMFNEALQDKQYPKLSDSLLKLTQDKQAEIEELTFQYFLDLKNLCRPEQQDKFKWLMHEILQRRPEGNGGDNMSPPSEALGPPRRPKNNH